MTNHWIDYKNADVIMAIVANTAEAHPISMQWVEEARRNRGAKLIAVDPRRTRTSSVADIYAPLRPGTDIAFLGGMINYILENRMYDEDYIKDFTNASYLVDPEFSFQDGMFSGAQGQGPDFSYDKSTWIYQTDEDGNVIKDESLQNPQSVFQLMKEHYSRYDIDSVCSITGTPKEQYMEVLHAFASSGRPGQAGTILYAMGITQHTYGSQNVRAIAMVQLLLGNVGLAGGGVNAQRGESNVQGSTDMALLFHILPGYMPAVNARAHPNLEAYHATTPASGYWSNRPKFMNSLLKAWWGDAAHVDNDFCFDYLPKHDGTDHSHPAMFENALGGNMEGMVFWGQNPAVGGANTRLEREAMSKLKWMVVMDIFETESAAFWKAPGVDPSAIETEVFMLPAAVSYEKEGSINNSGRWIQWRNAAVEPLGESKRDLWIADRLYKAIKQKYEEEGGAFPDPILNLNWDYEKPGQEDPDIEKVALEINGYYTAVNVPVANFTQLQDDGSTACGNWLFSGYYADPENPACKRRVAEKEGIGNHLEWSFAWPLNRRILYNRASSDRYGQPRCPDRPVVWWEDGQWQLNDVPDFGWISDGTHIPPEESANRPFIMLPELQARLFSAGMADGPFPEHYEPVESPVRNAMSGTQTNPAARITISDLNKLAEVASPDFPYVASTYRVAEHWQSGIMTRNMPWLNELMPDMFVELSPGLAQKLGIKNGDRVAVSTIRGEIEVIACVSRRLQPMLIAGQEIEIVGMPWHWGFEGMSKGSVANDITPHVGDANTSIPEYKAFLCNVRRVS